MNKIFKFKKYFNSAATLIFLLTPLWTFAQTQQQIIVAGDSWARFLCNDKGYRKTFDLYGTAQIKENDDCEKTSKNGIEAREWLTSVEHIYLKKKIRNFPAITFVHLSIGGNDLISRWNKSLSINQQEKLFEENFILIEKVVSELLIANNKLKVIVSGYDFPRFTKNHPISKYEKLLKQMGDPSPLELNSALLQYHIYLHKRFSSHPLYQKNIYPIHHLGISHYHDGITEAQIPKKKTLSPDSISSLKNPSQHGGEINFMSDKKSMKLWFPGIYDAFHLSPDGNQKLAEHTYRNIIIKKLQRNF